MAKQTKEKGFKTVCNDIISAHPKMPICQSIVRGRALSGVHSETVDFGLRQGRTRVFAAGVAALR